MRIVVDTNVLISGVVQPNRHPGQVIEAVGRGDCTLVMTSRLWSELERTLGYSRVRDFIARHGGETSVPVAVARLQTLVEYVPMESPTMSWLASDPDDDWVIQCAVTGRADVIVSGDRALLALKEAGQIPVMSAATFVEEILKGTR